MARDELLLSVLVRRAAPQPKVLSESIPQPNWPPGHSLAESMTLACEIAGDAQKGEKAREQTSQYPCNSGKGLELSDGAVAS